METSEKQLQDNVDHIADELTNPPELDQEYIDNYLDSEYYEPGDTLSAYDYLQDALDIQYIVSRNKEYLGARVLVAFGGPNIWINTQTETVEGYWWSDSAFASFRDNLGLDDALEDLYNC
jgi:hypothetical protein